MREGPFDVQLVRDAFLGEHSLRPPGAADTVLAWRFHLAGRAAEAVGWVWAELGRPGPHHEGEHGRRAGEWRLLGYQVDLARLRRHEPMSLTLGPQRWAIRPVRVLRLIPVASGPPPARSAGAAQP
ncbi:hypothetical protein E1265_34330 [Streptomyces sp. 8K308]|uniref:hypothetical protein n=1 Tax=Streptomyces sp. 8K308 TaxID=2530388 RepID=UPI00104EF9C0|nr:hypothetical protein [Streptomyces sp. 8K308]TDC07036.1 hypothetical protein E1265_34330 [Streptomyces sp. 8K308]